VVNMAMWSGLRCYQGMVWGLRMITMPFLISPASGGLGACTGLAHGGRYQFDRDYD
jgi:hypothetical protein